MSIRHLKRPYNLIALAVLIALTAYLFAFNRARRRAHVPAMTITIPPFPHPGQTRIGGVRSFSFAPRGQRITIVDDIGRWFIADLQGGAPRPIGRPGGAGPGSIMWSRDALRVYGAQDGVLKWRVLQEPNWRELIAAREDDPPARPTIKLSPDTSYLFVSMYHEREGPWKPGTVWLSAVPSGRRLWGGELKEDAKGFLPFVCGSAFSPDAQTLAVATMFFGDPTGRTGFLAQSRSESLSQMRLDIVLRRVRDGGVVRVIEIKMPDAEIRIPDAEIPINGDNATKGIALAFSPDGLLLAAADGDKVHLFSTKDGSLLGTLPAAENNIGLFGEKPLVFSPDGRLLAVGFYKAIEVWDVQKQQRRQLFFGMSRNLSFSGDSKWLASDDDMRAYDKVLLWEVGSLK